MKKLGLLVMPLMAISLLSSCGCSKEPAKVSYTLTYTYDNGSTDKYVETYDKDKKTEKPTWKPEYANHTFDGWFTKSGKEGDSFTFGNVLTDNTVVYAHWTENPAPAVSHKLIYHFDNGTSETYTETYVGDKETKEPTWTPSYDGHTFKGWYENKQDEGTDKVFTFGNPLELEVTEIHAHWAVTPTPKTTYHLTFYGTHCKMDGEYIYNENIPIGASTQRKLYPDEGYNLPRLGMGIELTIEGDGESSISYQNGNIIITKFRGDVIITANPSLKEYTVHFDENGGQLDDDAQEDIAITHGTMFKDIDNYTNQKATKDGCIFKGWSLSPTDITTIGEEYLFSSGENLYAVYTPITTIAVKLSNDSLNCILSTKDGQEAGPGSSVNIPTGVETVLTVYPINNYLPVFSKNLTVAGATKYEFDQSTKELTITVNSAGCEVTAKTASLSKGKLNNYSWEEICKISEDGGASAAFETGDDKDVYLIENGTKQALPHKVRIIGFNHDDLADGSGKAGITFEFANVITKGTGASAEAYTTTWNKEGWYLGTNFDYRESVLNTFLNSETDDASIINMLPSSGDPNNPDLREVIKQVDKKVGVNESKTAGSQYYTATSFDGDTHPYPYLFSLAHNEMADNAGDVTEGEGSKYQYYIKHSKQEDRIKRKAGVENGNGEEYWLRSPDTSNDSFAWIVDDDGYIGALGIVYEDIKSVAPAFCIK